MKTELLKYWKALALIALASASLAVAIQMSQAQNRWAETIETPTPGTKGRNAAIGAVSGGLLGGVGATVIGGIGVVAMGTGFGIPAGAGLIALAASIGAGSGAVVGAATGTSAGINTTRVDHVSSAYESWQWILLIAISLIIYLYAILEFRKTRQNQITAESA